MKSEDLLRQVVEKIPRNLAITWGNRVFYYFATPKERENAELIPDTAREILAHPIVDKPRRTFDIKKRLQFDDVFAMYCKSYRGDIQRVIMLIDSFIRHNKDNIKLFISVPEVDYHLFTPLTAMNIEVITDESFAAPFLTDHPFNGMSTGYVNQEICKLTFYGTGLSANYLTLDSDCYFIRDFYVSDFMHDSSTPYTILVQDKDLSIERHYRNVHWMGRQQLIEKIYAYVGVDDRRFRTCHGMQVFNSTVLDSLSNDFMMERNLTYVQMLEIAGYEFTWYNVWFQKCRLVPEFAVEPFFKTLHMRPEYIFSRLKGLREEDYANAYVGIVMNSKWRPTTPLRYEDPTQSYICIYNSILGNEEYIEAIANAITNTRRQ